MNIRTQQIVSRINNDALRQAATLCLDVADRFGQRAASIKSDPSFTAVGREKVLMDEAAKTYLPGLKVAFAPIAKAFADAKTARAAISIPAPDPSNIAAALERQEIRAMVRAMSPNERMSFLMGTVDERIVDAVLSAPGVLSGLLDEQFGQLRDQAVERRFGDRVAEIREAEETAEAAQAAMLVARNDIRAATGLDERAFDRFEKKAVVTPWLKKTTQYGTRLANGEFVGGADGPDTREFIAAFTPGKSTDNIREATGDEIALGKFYANYDAYLADNPGIKDIRLAEAA